MDPVFRQIYREQLELYRMSQAWSRYVLPQGPFEPRTTFNQLGALSLAAAAIDRAAEQSLSGRVLRPDARLFLLINLHQLVVLPLMHPDSPTRPAGTFESDLVKDAQAVISSAVSEAPFGREVDAADAIKGAAKVVDTLNAKSWRLWDTNER